MKNDVKQLADIMADWCGEDLIRLGYNRPVKAEWIAEEAICSLLYTLAKNHDARILFSKLLAAELEAEREFHSTRQELDDAGAI